MTNGMTTLELLEQTDTDRRTAVDTLEARVEEFRAQELAKIEGMRAAADVLAHLAREEGETVANIARIGLHTRDRNTAYTAIARGAALVGEKKAA